jgi:hypothetical protein
LLSANISSAEFLQRSEHHGIQSLLYHVMKRSDNWRGWPPEVRQVLEESSKARVAQEMLRGHFLRKLLRVFADRNMPCLLTKGEALASTIYPIPGTRTRCDSDLFIRIPDIETARQAVLHAGFQIVSPIYKTHQFVVRREAEGLDVFEFDVHWRVLNAPRYARILSFDEAYDRSIALPGMEPARALNLVDALLLACMHRTGSVWHDQERLIWIYDIHLLVSGMSPEQLGEFVDKAVKLDVQASCREGILRSSDRFGTSLPQELMAVLALPEAPSTFSRRYAQSNLGLLVDDWRRLPDFRARRALLRELFLPSAASLLHNYGKEDRRWLPILWLRQVFGGLAQRILFR